MNQSQFQRRSQDRATTANRTVYALVFFVTVLLTLGCQQFQMLWVSRLVLAQAHMRAMDAGIEVPHPSESRILLYEYELSPGFIATSADTGEIGNPMVCENRCWLFFVDFNPTAHFAHPTAIALYDLDTNRIELQLANWWPALARPSELPEYLSIFSTVEQREARDNRVHPDPAEGMIPEVPVPIPAGQPRREITIMPLYSPSDTVLSSSGANSKTWALLVQGYSDLSDTFFDDVSRSAKVMDGLRVPSTNIRTIKPLVPSTEDKTCIERLDDAMDYLLDEMADGECEEFVFYFSSHGKEEGDTGGLLCSYDVWDEVRYWTGDNLEAMLNKLGPNPDLEPESAGGCDKVTVVLQSCYSGSFIDKVHAGLDGVKHVVITSSDIDQLSYTDIDNPEDENEGDVGTEFSSGFWEAFGREDADGIIDGTKDLEVDLAEAFAYADDRDVTTELYETSPQMKPSPETGLDPKTFLNTNASLPADELAELKITEVVMNNNYGLVGQIVKDAENRFVVKIENTSEHFVPVLTVRIVREVTAGSYREVGRTQLGASLKANNVLSTTVKWWLSSSYPVGSTVDICIVADSPVVGDGNAAKECIDDVPVVANPTPTPGPCFLGCTH